jgi:hypothetical protein
VKHDAPIDRALGKTDQLLARFNAGDVHRHAATLSYPHVRLASGSVRIWSHRASTMPAPRWNIAALRAGGGDHSEWDPQRVIHVADDEVHPERAVHALPDGRLDDRRVSPGVHRRCRGRRFGSYSAVPASHPEPPPTPPALHALPSVAAPNTRTNPGHIPSAERVRGSCPPAPSHRIVSTQAVAVNAKRPRIHESPRPFVTEPSESHRLPPALPPPSRSGRQGDPRQPRTVAR